MTHPVEHKTIAQPPDPAPLIISSHRNFRGATYHAVYEAGHAGFWIHDQFREMASTA